MGADLEKSCDRQMAEAAILFLNCLPVPTPIFKQRNLQWTFGLLDVLRQHPSAHMRLQAAALILNYCHQQKSTEAGMRARLSQLCGAPFFSTFNTHFDWLPLADASEGIDLLREIHLLLQLTLQVWHSEREVVMLLHSVYAFMQFHCFACSSCCSTSLLAHSAAQVSLVTFALPFCMCSLSTETKVTTS